MKHKALSIAILSLHCGLMANPTNPQVSNGDVSFDASTPGVLNIQADDRSIINWQDFSIQAGEITQFIQPDSSSAVLNRVMGGNASSIMGNLQANGKVYLINPSGVIFGKDSVIDTGALLASTLDLPDQLFLQDGDLLFSGNSNAALVNFGAIKASNGDVILIGYQVENNGTIDAPNGVAAIAAGREVLIHPLAQERIYIRLKTAEENMSGVGIDSAGKISALQAELKADGNSFAKAINHSGSIEATGIVDQGGRVYLVSSNGNMEITGFIAAQDGQGAIKGNGGGVDLLAQNIAMSPDAVVNVDGGSSGNGGTVLFFADNAAIFYGTISAEGGEMGGDGGFVEVSGPSLDFSGKVSTYAPVGKTGSLLLDPYYITISNAPTTTGTMFRGISGNIYNGLQIAPSAAAFPYTSTSNLNINGMGGLVEQLGMNNVIIDTNVAVAGELSLHPSAGNIDFLDPVIWSSDNSLTVNAENDLNIFQSVIKMGTGELKFTTTNGDINVGKNPMGLGVQVGCVGGASPSTVIIDAAKNLNIIPGSTPNAFAQIGLDKPVVNCDIKVIRVGGQVNLQKGGANGCYSAIGHGGTSKAASLKGKISVNVQGEFSSGVFINGGSGLGCHAIIGHFAEPSAPVTIAGAVFVRAGSRGPIEIAAGTGTNSFALIGHGGNSVAAGSNLSAISVRAVSHKGNVTLKGGMGLGSGAFAAIGLTNGGNADPGNVTVNGSSFFQVVADSPHSINLIAGNQPGNNANIGFLFNNTTIPNTINIEAIEIYCGDLTVTGSPEGTGSSGAFAIIGATSNPAGIAMRPMNVVDSNITMRLSGNFKLKAGLGAAKILTGDSIIKTNRNLSISLNVGNSIASIIAGSAEASLFSTGILGFYAGNINFLSSTSSSAKATSNGNITFFANENFTLNNSTTAGLQQAEIVSNFGNASVQASNITMNRSSLIGGKGTVTVNATAGDLIIQEHSLDDSCIQNFGVTATTLRASRNINIQESLISPGGSGTFTLDAGNHLIIGNASNALSTVVGQTQGTNSVSAGGNLQVIGGAGDAAFALLGSLGGGNIQYDITRVGGSVSVLGGSGRACFAQIGTNDTSGLRNVIGNITFNEVTGNVILTAGTGNISFAQIGSQGNIVNCTVAFTNVNGNVTLTPKVATNAFAQIGSRYNAGSPGVPELSVKGTITPCFNNPPCDNPPCDGTPYAVIKNVKCAPVP